MITLLHTDDVSTDGQDKLTPFGQRLRASIAKAGFKSRNQFLKAAGLDPMTVYRWETGKVSSPNFDLLRPVADMLSVSVDYLLSGDTPVQQTRVERENAYPALTEYLASPEGQMATTDEIEQLREVRFRNEPTTLSYRYLLNAIRAGIPEAQQAEIAEFNAQILARALAKGGRMLPPKSPKKR